MGRSGEEASANTRPTGVVPTLRMRRCICTYVSFLTLSLITYNV